VHLLLLPLLSLVVHFVTISISNHVPKALVTTAATTLRASLHRRHRCRRFSHRHRRVKIHRLKLILTDDWRLIAEDFSPVKLKNIVYGERQRGARGCTPCIIPLPDTSGRG
jgi:hypothetical protein